MFELPPHRALYAAFDRFPSRKGSAIHIDRFARTLFDESGGGLLYVLGGDGLPAHQRDGDIDIVRFSQPVANFLERAARFGANLTRLVEQLDSSLEVCHFRDPWSGAPIALRTRRRYATVFEVNALPSIELPYLFPAVAPRTLAKVRALELACCDASDRIITPSATTANFLESLGIGARKIAVIPNGADVDPPLPRPADAPDEYLIYVGSPQTWQGVDALLRAFARLADFPNLALVICGSRASKGWRRHEKLAEKLRLSDRIVWRFALPGPELAAWLQHARISAAALTNSPRNVLQGCAPLKVLESMAAGVPVVASDVPPIRELITHRDNGWLVHPDRPGELARALRVLLDDRELAATIAARGRSTIAARFTWTRSLDALRDEYRSLKGASADERIRHRDVQIAH